MAEQRRSQDVSVLVCATDQFCIRRLRWFLTGGGGGGQGCGKEDLGQLLDTK